MTLEKWMADQKLDDAAVAARLGDVSRSQVSRLRRRVSLPSIETARKLEKLTGIPAWSLMTAKRRPVERLSEAAA